MAQKRVRSSKRRRAFARNSPGASLRRAHTTCPHHIVGTLFHAALEEELEPGNERFDRWVEARAAAKAIRDGATLRGLQRKLAELLRRYYASDLQAEVQRATWVQREVPFTRIGAAGVVLENEVGERQGSLFAAQSSAQSFGDGRLPLRQGKIDLLFRAQDGVWHVVDFKTDHLSRQIPSSEDQKKLAHYHEQLRAYGQAVRQLVGAAPRLRLCLLDDHGVLTVKEIT